MFHVKHLLHGTEVHIRWEEEWRGGWSGGFIGLCHHWAHDTPRARVPQPPRSRLSFETLDVTSWRGPAEHYPRVHQAGEWSVAKLVGFFCPRSKEDVLVLACPSEDIHCVSRETWWARQYPLDWQAPLFNRSKMD